MQKFLLLCVAALFSGMLMAQPIFIDQFDDGNVTTGETANFDVTEANGELVISGNGNNGEWDIVFFGLGSTLDLSQNAKVYVRAKSSALGTRLRVDLADTNNNSTNTAPQEITLTDEYRVVELDFGSIDVGSVDLSAINAMYFFINGGTAGFTDQVAIDFISIGEEPAGVIMSDIYQDDMDSDSSLTNFVNDVPGFTRERRDGPSGEGSLVTFVGDGTAGMWTPHAYALRPAPEYIQTSVDITDNPKVFVKMRTSVPGTTIRIDAQDEDNISSIGNAITRVLTDEFAVYEFDYTGAFQNFENDACPAAATDPCDVNLEAIKELLMYVNPGTGLFAGTVDFEWISFGVNLDGEGPEAVLGYSDDFEDGMVTWTGGSQGLFVDEAEGNLIISGDGTSGEFGTVSYDFYESTDDQDTAFVQRTVDFKPAQNKVYIRARTDGGAVPVRIDIIDTASLSTNIAALTKRVTGEWQVLEYDFTGTFQDAGYGGAPGCTPEMPCLLNDSLIRGIFLYVNPGPGAGMFSGNIEIDWLSVGQPLEVTPPSATGVVNYNDLLENVGEFLSGTPDNITYTAADGVVTLSGNGMSAQYQQIRYTLRDAEGNAAKADAAGSSDRLYVRARVRNADAANLRIDLADEGGFESTNAGALQAITGEEYAVYEYDFAGRYTDGGFGGTSCAMANAPCDVDAQRITTLIFYPAPDAGMFAGDIDIDWVSFGEPLIIDGVRNFAEVAGMRLYPNPAGDELAVEYDLTRPSEIAVSLFDGLGRRVLTQDFGQQVAGNHFNRLDLSQLATGTYHLQVSVNGVPARAQTVFKR